jgi:hypothetical protein
MFIIVSDALIMNTLAHGLAPVAPVGVTAAAGAVVVLSLIVKKPERDQISTDRTRIARILHGSENFVGTSFLTHSQRFNLFPSVDLIVLMRFFHTPPPTSHTSSPTRTILPEKCKVFEKVS